MEVPADISRCIHVSADPEELRSIVIQMSTHCIAEELMRSVEDPERIIRGIMAKPRTATITESVGEFAQRDVKKTHHKFFQAWRRLW